MWFYDGPLGSNAWNIVHGFIHQCKRTLDKVVRDILVMHSLPVDCQELNGYVWSLHKDVKAGRNCIIPILLCFNSC